MESSLFSWLLLSCCLFAFPAINIANQIDHLDRLMELRRSSNPPRVDSWDPLDSDKAFSPICMSPQDGLMEADKIVKLPGQPEGVNFDQYAGHVTVDPQAGRALFYYFVESPEDPSTKPLVLWLNGGPGCSSFGIGAMEELGPFRVNSDGKTLFRNDYAWNEVSNVIFLESPASVGFSYSTNSSDYELNGDKRTAEDSYTFLVNWLERFPQYKGRDFFITGESYAGHYVPQLAYTILQNNNGNQTGINLKGIAIGNAWIDDATSTEGMYDYFWTHALNSDEVNDEIASKCDFSNANFSSECLTAQYAGNREVGGIDIYNIYAPLCHDANQTTNSTGSVAYFDPCSDNYVAFYLNLPEVQWALHANITASPYPWGACSGRYNWSDSPTTILPIIKELMASSISVWIYSGDTDGRVPVTSSRYSINTLGLPILNSWRPWYTNEEVGGYVVQYEGLVFATVRGAGHLVPSYQPERALTIISAFLQGKLPPSQ